MLKLNWQESSYFEGEIASIGALGEVHVRKLLGSKQWWYVTISGASRTRNPIHSMEDAKIKAEQIVAREIRRLARRLFAKSPAWR